MRELLESLLVKHWYIKQRDFSYYLAHVFLLLLSWIFAVLSLSRRRLYQLSLLATYKLNVPVIVIGNITVGGTGKTPLVIWLAEQLQQAGYTPGIISRGFGGKPQNVVRAVFASSHPSEMGDEPVLIAQRTNCPIFVSANRLLAGQQLLKVHPQCDVIISDDGLQHYQLARTVEIAVVDSQRLFGNACLLPAGPLRESVARLNTVDAVVVNVGIATESAMFENTMLENAFAMEIFTMEIKAGQFVNVADRKITASVVDFQNKNIKAIAGIGNPERFFQQLSARGLSFKSYAYPDHYSYKAADFELIDADLVLMTEKDAVKCRAFATEDLASKLWFLPIEAQFTEAEELMSCVLDKLAGSSVN